MLFVLLHELGHIKLGHTEAIRSWPSLSEVGPDVKRELLSRSRRFEFEADAFASRQILLLSAEEKQVQKGIAFFFSLLNTCERQTVTTPTELRTHPAAPERFQEAMSVICSEEDMTTWSSLFQGLNQMFNLRVVPPSG